MDDTKLHRFRHDVSSIERPTSFTYPFSYTPHALCKIAKEEVFSYIESKPFLREELDLGKMIGVLVVCLPNNSLEYLVAYSGNLEWQEDYFVPPIYNLLDENGFFKKEEREISEVNRRISSIEEGQELSSLRLKLKQIQEDSQRSIGQTKEQMRRAKTDRDEKRKQNITPEEECKLIAESQFQKAELRRMSQACKAREEEVEAKIREIEEELTALKKERKEHSIDLQKRIFRSFRLLNAQGEERDLIDIFQPTAQRIPPSGAGECAAPRLLQYALKNGYKPIAMAEYWWGNSPKGEVRIHGNHYPACIGKCRPILEHQLKGMDVSPNPMDKLAKQDFKLKVMYEDEWLIVVDKPAGMLSVPGKLDADSAMDRVRDMIGKEPYAIHRLDMQTSGLLVVAKDKATHLAMQRQFRERKVEKRYAAVVCGKDMPDEGEIRLPICPDYDHRPCQKVDFRQGKESITLYRVAKRMGERTFVHFFPKTGRTHQLRVHSAHQLGLNAPILGDMLYGEASDRLYLHAEYVRFRHPHTGEILSIESPPDFFS